MSQENNNNSSKAGGQGRQGGNNSNKNRNRNRKRPNQRGGQGGNYKNRGRQGGPRQGRQGKQGDNPRQGRQTGGGRKRQPAPVPLTLWEKILKFFGLYKEPTRPPRRQAATKKAAKASTRNTRGNDSQNKGPIKAKGQGAGEKGKNFPVETPRLYLGNLSYDATEKDLEELFKGIGTVRSVEIIYNRHTHRSKGYGFLEMLSVEEAKRAVEELHDKAFMGRNLIVNGASAKPAPDPNRPPREPREPRTRKPRENQSSDNNSGKGHGEGRGEKRNSPAKLRLDNISFDADESALEDHFKGVGNVRRVELVYNRQTHKPKGYGYVEMQKTEDAKKAIEVLHDQPFMGRKLAVTLAGDPTPEPTKPEASETEEPTKPEVKETPQSVEAEAPAETATESVD